MTQITTSWQKVKEIYVGNDGYHDVYWRLYARISAQTTTNTTVAIEGRLYLTGSAGSITMGATTTVGGVVGSVSQWGIDKTGTYYTGETTLLFLSDTIANSTGSTTGGARFYSSPWGWTGENLYLSDTLTFTTVPTAPTTSASTTGTTSNRATYGTTSFGTAGSGIVYLYGGTSASPTTQIDSKTTTGNSNYSHTGLNPNTKYYYRARAKSSVGWSDYSSDASAVTLSGPSSMSVSDITTTSITVSYTTRSGGGVYAQNVQYSIDYGSTWITGATVAAGTTASKTGTFTITGLTSGETYPIDTRISTTAGIANYSTRLWQTTAQAPTKPTTSSSNTSYSQNTVTYGTTSFGVPASGTVYLYGGTSTAPTTSLTSKTTTGNSSYSHTGLTPNTKYYYRSRAKNSKDYWSSYSSESTQVTRSYLTAASVQSYTTTSITVSYTIAAGGGELAQNIQYSIDGGTTWANGATVAAGITAATSGTFTISGLTSGTTYSILLRANSTVGATQYGTTLTQKTSVAPTGGTLTLTGKTYNSISFTGGFTSYGYPEDGHIVIGVRDTAGSSARTEAWAAVYPTLSGSVTLTNESTKKGGGCDLYGCRAVYPFLWATNEVSSSTPIDSTTPEYLPPAPLNTLILTGLVTTLSDVTASVQLAGKPADGVNNATGATVTTEYRYVVGEGSYSNWTQLGANEAPDTVHNITLSALPFNTTITVQARQSFAGEYSEVKSLSFTTSPRPLGVYGSVNSEAKIVVKGYGSVNGVAKTIVKGYGSVNGVTKRIY